MPLNSYMSHGIATLDVRTDDTDTIAEALVLTNPEGYPQHITADFVHPVAGVADGHGEADPGDPPVEMVLDPPLKWDSDNGDFFGIRVNMSSF